MEPAGTARYALKCKLVSHRRVARCRWDNAGCRGSRRKLSREVNPASSFLPTSGSVSNDRGPCTPAQKHRPHISVTRRLRGSWGCRYALKCNLPSSFAFACPPFYLSLSLLRRCLRPILFHPLGDAQLPPATCVRW